MTWLKGTTTWGNLVSDLTKLLCGEIADGSGTTVASADRWVREIAGQDLIRPPDSTAVALGTMYNRAGYWNVIGYRNQAGSNPDAPIAQTQTSLCVQTAIASALTFARLRVDFVVNTANTVAGNYSTAQVGVLIYNGDTGSTIVNTTYNISATGDLTNNSYFGTVRFSDPSGVLQLNARWSREFVTAYPGGIDWMGPMLWRRLAAPTFSVAPAGTSGTDWAYVESVSSTNTAFGVYYSRGGAAQGVGYKTNVALNGAQYAYTYSAAQTKIRLFSTVAGQVQMQQGGWVQDQGAGAYVIWGPNTNYATWLRTHQTAASVTNASSVQYWISVKGGAFKVILNADPGQTGKSTCNWVAPLSTRYLTAAQDPFNFVWGDNVLDTTVDSQTLGRWMVWTAMPLYAALKRTDGSEGRDFQTGWARTDFVPTALAGLTNGSDGQSLWSSSSTSNSGAAGYSAKALYCVALLGDRNINNNGVYDEMLPAVTTKPSPIDGKWWLGQIVLSEGFGDTTQNSAYTGDLRNTAQSNFPRGAMDDKVLYLPGGGWGSGDELSEASSGKTWFCIAADYPGLLSRVRTATTVYQGGVAVLEE